MIIPFNRPAAMARELEYITTAVETGGIGGAGEFAAKCQALLENALGVKKALLTTSCTAALEITAMLIDSQPGDETILPSFTFPSTANAFVLRGAKPIFVDIRPDTLNIDENLIERHLTKRTKAIVAVHYAGVACELDAIVDLARGRSIALIEDNAHGLFGKYKDRHLGTFGRAFSAVKWTNTPGLIWDRATRLQTFSRRICWRNWKCGRRSRSCAKTSGIFMPRICANGRSAAKRACL